MESSAQTARVNVLDFFVKSKNKISEQKHAKIPFLGCMTKSSNMTRVVLAGDSKTGLGIKIGPR